MPPYLAGRENEKEEFKKLLEQTTIMQNLVLTGLRGVGKTVLSETFKPLAQQAKWLWVGTDLSESASISEENIAVRLITDLSVLTSSISIGTEAVQSIGFTSTTQTFDRKLTFDVLYNEYKNTAGLPSDKLKHVLEVVWQIIKPLNFKGIIFAYDEAQNLSDHASKEQFPLSLLLDTFQSLQRKDVPFMLALTGLPTLFPKLVDARTYAERMFRVITLDKLDKTAVKEAILTPLEKHPLKLTSSSVDVIIDISGGYPYFIQFICREVYDLFINQFNQGQQVTGVPQEEILLKLDSDFFAGRWARATDRQRDLMLVIAHLENCESEFSVQEILEQSKGMNDQKEFSSSHINQMLSTLINFGLIYKNRYGKYSFAVPLLGQFILRQQK
ncbi:MAG: ATP-binding protein [Acinetobacter sp.]|uniref:AAA family ATPase n=1 Tax=Acinetobacter sp. TaxID=472 RepID=UPI002842B7F0|nr:AAA family ATPase [Acinetobacter sp.]MDR3027248.1 ATP-binding protein [Acinetobacter sp.]